MNLSFNQKTTQLGVLFVLAFIWGSSFILMKRGLDAFSPGQVAALRMFLSATFFIPFTVSHLRTLKRPQVRPLIVASLLGNLIPAFLFTVAEMHISSSLAGMLNALTPFFALTLGVVWYQTRVKWWNVGGIFTGLIGAIGLIAAGASFDVSGDWRYALLVVLATLFYGINVNIIKNKLADLKPVAVASLALTIAGSLSGIYLLFTDFQTPLQSPLFWPSLGYILILAFFGTTLALVTFNTLIKATSALFASSVTYIIPIFAIIWGLFDNETIAPLQFFWITIILLGVYLVNKK
ncbi:MAG: hypothetical protein RIS47_417 [Bacteroidota bacterium]|jgi:drug/metabolite transporter (DMT)-like permease